MIQSNTSLNLSAQFLTFKTTLCKFPFAGKGDTSATDKISNYSDKVLQHIYYNKMIINFKREFGRTRINTYMET